MSFLRRYREEVTNQKGLTFQFFFEPFLKRLTITCVNSPGLAFRSYVEEVVEPLGLEEVDDVLMGITYKCSSYERFQEIKASVQKS